MENCARAQRRVDERAERVKAAEAALKEARAELAQSKRALEKIAGTAQDLLWKRWKCAECDVSVRTEGTHLARHVARTKHHRELFRKRINGKSCSGSGADVSVAMLALAEQALADAEGVLEHIEARLSESQQQVDQARERRDALAEIVNKSKEASTS